MAVYTLEDEQIVWTNKSSGWTNTLAFVLLWIYAVLSWTFLSRFHTRGRTTHQDGQIVWHLPHCEFMLYCRWLVHLDGQIIFPDGQISDNLFVEKFVCLFAHQMIWSSETICPCRQFVHPLVWKWPLSLVWFTVLPQMRNFLSNITFTLFIHYFWKKSFFLKVDFVTKQLFTVLMILQSHGT